MGSLHETPDVVAKALARHAPRRIRSLLDPAVGRGALLLPFLNGVRSARSKITVIDKNRALCRELASHKNWGRLSVIHGNFLKLPAEHFPNAPYDCIVMNPPYAARKESWVNIPAIDCTTAPFMAPPECAFVIKALSLLAHGGRLLAVLPASVMCADSSTWLRKWLHSNGRIEYVHELPAYTFKGVEARVFLLAYIKHNRSTRITLYNHCLAHPQKMTLKSTKLDAQVRLDYSFQYARFTLDSYIRQINLDWRRLGEVACILRGSEESPAGPRYAIHTTDFHDGFWVHDLRHDGSAGHNDAPRVMPGDILVQRVGRRPSRTMGGYIGISGLPCSDCLFIVRPRKKSDKTRILFGARILFSTDIYIRILEYGTGASFISSARLRDIQIPFGLPEKFPHQYSAYIKALKNKDHNKLLVIESDVLNKLSL